MGGFSLNFHGKISQDVLLQRQDAEIRLLEIMKRCFSLKVKCDKEYGYALCNLAAKNSENFDNNNDIWTGSSVWKFWKNWTSEVEVMGKVMKENAENMEGNLVEMLGNLCVEKRKMKKILQEEYCRIQQQLNNITEEVSKKKMEYQKCLECYKLTRTKFEEYYVKNGKSGRKLDEVRDKYQKACRKLHLTHNEYVLLLCEAVEFEKDFRTVLLPGLLERQQNLQENFIGIWKQILQDITNSTALTSENLRKIENSVGNINPNEEYKEFIEKFKSTPNEENSKMFSFDESLTEDETLKFSPNQLTVDNLTIEWLKKKLNELETKIKDTEEKRNALISSSNTNGKAQIFVDVSSRISNLLDSDNTKRDIDELQCTERKNKKQAELIKSALNELGCEEAPSGCDFSTTVTNENQQQQKSIPSNGNMEKQQQKEVRASVGMGVVKKNGGKFVNILRKPFRRRSMSPVAPPRINKTGIPRRGSSNSEGGEHQPFSVKISSDEKSLGSEEWFHGVLPREEVVRLLVQDGDFLVRETTRNDESQTVLSVCWGGHKHFIVQTTAEGQYRFEGPSFPTIRDLILYQHGSGLPVTGRSGAILLKPIPRERWELNNDDVILVEKIGRGNFGDVYRAHLKENTSEIFAVKTCRGTLPDDHKRKFLQEGRILKQYEHPNIVKLIGICVQKQPIMIVMELVPGGSLLTFLRKHQGDISLTIKNLIKMCLDVAAGMRYLESKNCIHRDLAARNCLIGYDNVVKISDFGMSREEEEYVVSDGMKQIPIKWTAPEALNFGKYTSACDVWSYGILCWEIFSHGDTPYSGMSNSKAREMIDSGYRMPTPGNGKTPEEIYRLMLRCWEYEPEKRPNFDQIYSVVETIYNSFRLSN